MLYRKFSPGGGSPRIQLSPRFKSPKMQQRCCRGSRQGSVPLVPAESWAGSCCARCLLVLGQCPGPCLLAQHLTLPPSRQLRCRKPRSCSSAPPCSFTFPAGRHPGKVPTNTASCPTWPPALWRAEDAHHLHMPLLQPPLQPCPGWGDVMPLSSPADVRSYCHP